MSTGTGSTPTTPTGDGLATAALVEQTPVPPTQSQGDNQGVGARVHPQAELLDAILASLYRGTGPENDEICELVVGNFQRLDLFLAATDEDFDRMLDDLGHPLTLPLRLQLRNLRDFLRHEQQSHEDERLTIERASLLDSAGLDEHIHQLSHQAASGGADKTTKKEHHSIIILIERNCLSAADPSDVDAISKIVRYDLKLEKRWGGDQHVWPAWKENFLTALTTLGFAALFDPNFTIPPPDTPGRTIYNIINRWVYKGMDTAITKQGGQARSMLTEYRQDSTGTFIMDAIAVYYKLIEIYADFS